MIAFENVPVRFRRRMTCRPDGCWDWTGYIRKDGYGHTGADMAHRALYKIGVGGIPDGMQIDHLCFNTRCVNPAHLEPVTDLENKRRRYARYTHCANGHEFTSANTYFRPNSGHRDCRQCIRDRAAAYQRRKRAAA